jgi:type II secretory pathway pseudopilin PulG
MKVSPFGRRAFTLFEMVLAMAILMLLSGAVFTLTGAAMEVARAAREEQTESRRQEGFLRVTQDAFRSLGSGSSVSLRMGKEGSAPVPEIVFENTAGAFGTTSLGDAVLVLAARPHSDGSRTFSIRRMNLREKNSKEAPWIPLLPGVENVSWSFFTDGEWAIEWPPGLKRPELVRLNFKWRDSQAPVEAIFWVPPIMETENSLAPQS